MICVCKKFWGVGDFDFMTFWKVEFCSEKHSKALVFLSKTPLLDCGLRIPHFEKSLGLFNKHSKSSFFSLKNNFIGLGTLIWSISKKVKLIMLQKKQTSKTLLFLWTHLFSPTNENVFLKYQTYSAIKDIVQSKSFQEF